MPELFARVEERELWIKLNAERIVRHLKRQDVPMGSIGEKWSAMDISNNQLVADEKNGKLRFTLAELLTCSHKELEDIKRRRHEEFIASLKRLGR